MLDAIVSIRLFGLFEGKMPYGRLQKKLQSKWPYLNRDKWKFLLTAITNINPKSSHLPSTKPSLITQLYDQKAMLKLLFISNIEINIQKYRNIENLPQNVRGWAKKIGKWWLEYRLFFAFF